MTATADKTAIAASMKSAPNIHNGNAVAMTRGMVFPLTRRGPVFANFCRPAEEPFAAAKPDG
ncbi:hypothetical protein ABRZ24_03295 [Brenneria populi]|uniref:Uncharacterized protein n=1 Tax=Brenneria populi TaxID=1505588 RepID=A0ABU6JM67_9GAMM|nr:hypothetical protein [Brenneria populi Li et al. 2015]